MTNNNPNTEEMDKAVKCLMLELPGPVWNDVNQKWQAFKYSLITPVQSSDEASSGQSYPRWVKLSDRPWSKINDDLIVRTVAEKGLINMNNVKWHKKNILHCDFDGAYGWYIKDIPYENIEWLEETPSIQEGKERAFTADQILKAAEEGEVSMIDAAHIVSILNRKWVDELRGKESE
jgi:hypothetical protein